MAKKTTSKSVATRAIKMETLSDVADVLTNFDDEMDDVDEETKDFERKKRKFDIKQTEFDLLIEQRNLIINSIILFTKSFHTSIFSILTLITAGASFTLDYYNNNDHVINDLYVFVISQMVFALTFFIIGLLFGMNDDREYIRAIDKYIEERYSIKTLFYQGDLSYRHINGNKSNLSIITLPAGFIVLFIVAGMLLNRGMVPSILSYIKENLFFALIIITEIILLLIRIILNFRYKLTGKSRFYDELLEYLNDKQTDGIKDENLSTNTYNIFLRQCRKRCSNRNICRAKKVKAAISSVITHPIRSKK